MAADSEVRKWVRRKEKHGHSYFFKKFSGEWKGARMKKHIMRYLRKEDFSISLFVNLK